MRAGLIVSVIGHLALALWGLISLPSPETLDMTNFEAVPVDFVPIEELTKLNLGVTKAEAREEVVPEPPAPKVAEAPPPPPPPPAPPEPEQVAEPAPPEPAPAPPPPPEPAPEPEPAKASEPAPAPEPPPPPEPAKAPEPKPEPPKEAVAKAVPAPVPRPRPAPPKKMEVASVQPKEEKEETFNTDEISALLDKSEPTGSTTPTETPPTLGSRSGSMVDQMSIDELDALRARLARCWNIQLAPPDISELRVKVKMFLNQDGSLSQSPEIVEAGSTEFARSAAESAIRAVRRCAPYSLPAEKYDTWQQIIVTFDPREMFGG
jgi:hypothetical protein